MYDQKKWSPSRTVGASWVDDGGSIVVSVTEAMFTARHVVNRGSECVKTVNAKM